MPATYTKERKTDRKTGPGRSGRGPLKCMNYESSDRNTVLGSSLDALHITQLPVGRSVLQRYRAVQNLEPNTCIKPLVANPTLEVCGVWNKAMTCLVSINAHNLHVIELIIFWNSIHKL